MFKQLIILLALAHCSAVFANEGDGRTVDEIIGKWTYERVKKVQKNGAKEISKMGLVLRAEGTGSLDYWTNDKLEVEKSITFEYKVKGDTITFFEVINKDGKKMNDVKNKYRLMDGKFFFNNKELTTANN
ncbi:MAG: hypothetical protein HRT89_00825 [Lentisphaeria bacterium]|nr:hypothetical protein [Lentisphaeria bacterium]NQZ66586.1 hypothetical protein [Lentisphaeria bacterium]